MNKAIRDILETLFEFARKHDYQHPHMIIAAELLIEHKTEIDIREIKMIVYRYFNLSEGKGDSKTRKRNIVQARQIAMELSWTISQEFKKKWSLADIGIEIGGKDHATVLHACKTVKNLRETDRRYNHIYNDLEIIIRSKLRENESEPQTDNIESQ